tara:strand:+ start:6466 stop:8733 length:2268 start_codon:yes stop_codon:yes gene_type:complete
MQRIRVPITNFQFGEISPSLTSRTDSPIYAASAQKVENLFLRAEGGVIKRSGLRNIYKYGDITYDAVPRQQVRIVPFIFSDDERYVVSLEDQKVRIFFLDPLTSNVSLEATITQDVNSNPLPWVDTYLHEVTYAQAGDVMFLCHNTFAPRQLVRTGLTTFQVELFTFQGNPDADQIYQPYYSFQGLDVTLGSSATTGDGITLTTSSAYFDITGSQVDGSYPSSKHIGITLRYGTSEIEIVSVQSTTSATGNILSELNQQLSINLFTTTSGSASIKVNQNNHGLSTGDSITVSGAGQVGGIAVNQINGARTIASIIDENNYTFDAGANSNAFEVGGGAPTIVTNAPTRNWTEQSFSVYRGYPAAVTLHENRLWFGGTLGQPDGVWSSKSSKYYNFDVGEAADSDSIQITSSIGEINAVRHMVSNRDLQIFTSTSELYIPALSNQPVTPTNARIIRQTPFGSGYARPQPFDGATVFVQNGGYIVREYLYTDTEAAYTSATISTLSSHLISDPIQMCVVRGTANTAESYIFLLNNNGRLAVFSSNRGEQRAGWTDFSTSGHFQSVTAVDNRIFMVVRYDFGSGTTRYALVELDASMNMDSAQNYTGTAGVFDVSNFFEDTAIVDVVYGSDYLGKYTVSGGEIDVSAVANITSCQVGYAFNVNLTTNPIDGQVQGGPLTGEPRTLARVILDLNETLSVSVNGTSLVIRQVTDDLSQERSAVTGKKEFYLLGYNRDPQVIITQTAPLPLQVNGIIAEVSF